ncbi:glutamate receptor ionotropic, NMDA 2B, partial [Hyalella azteca]|uniref:Glutamate receptor ionotropic, NMDA 2B n=1 Tax=Hyalella azteca TaxID=294128 RepID=A0A979FMK5_HYAAZ
MSAWLWRCGESAVLLLALLQLLQQDRIAALGSASPSIFGKRRGQGIIVGNQSIHDRRSKVFKEIATSTAPTSSVTSEDPPFPPHGSRLPLTVGIVLPASLFRKRKYLHEVRMAVDRFRDENKNSDLLKYYDFTPDKVIMSTLPPSSSPTKILDTICKEFLPRNVSAIMYLFNNEKFGRSTASVQYFFQLAGYLGIPVISWNADNSGLERDQRTWSLQLQLAPSIEHQASAMLSILQRYSWPKFAIVTTLIAGHNDFIQAVREQILELPKQGTEQEQELPLDRYSEQYRVQARVTSGSLLRAISCAGKSYLWIVTQSVIQSKTDDPPDEFPVGMLGVHFGTNESFMMSEISTAVKVFAWGTSAYVSDAMERGALPDLNPALSCDTGDAKWHAGSNYYRFLKNISIDMSADNPKIPYLRFNADGTRKAVELRIMNLRPDLSKKLAWEEIGVWYSWKSQGLEVKDIVWPGHAHVPPNGIPEKFHLRITFMEEPPFINMAPTNPLTGTCPADKGVLCRVATDEMMVGVNVTEAMRNSSYYRCCSGFCIDLLVKFSNDLGFSYDFSRVEDGIWGAIVNGKWTGLPAAVLAGKADMVITSIKINSQREQVMEFTVPFLDTGIAMVVSKRTGIISPTAFLEPFDLASWMMVAFVAIQVAAVAIFLFEWLSPSGYNMRMQPPRDHPFSLFRTLWLVWAILFQAAVNVDCPKGFTARFMGNVWAMFALIFLAIYTANLAAFMITREEFHDMSGLDDKRLQNP